MEAEAGRSQRRDGARGGMEAGSTRGWEIHREPHGLESITPTTLLPDIKFDIIPNQFGHVVGWVVLPCCSTKQSYIVYAQIGCPKREACDPYMGVARWVWCSLC